MMKKKSAVKTSLFAAQEREDKLDRKGDFLVKLNQYVNFVGLAEEIERVMERTSSQSGGRPPFPTELMIRVLVVQQLYNLSDEMLEYQLLDRLSFQRFCGLRESSSIPDAKTIWAYRERLRQKRGSEVIFNAVQKQLKHHGYLARGGQIVDATLVSVPHQHVDRPRKESEKHPARPREWSEAQSRQKDTQASWTKKHGRSHYGYKLSASVDHRYKFIRTCQVSTAKEHDTKHFERVLDPTNTCRDVWADKGYEDRERERRLQAAGWRIHIQRKAKRGRKQSPCQKRRNQRLAKPRARVEHVFAAMAAMGGKVLRSIGLARADFGLRVKAAVYNLRRLCTLKEGQVTPC